MGVGPWGTIRVDRKGVIQQWPPELEAVVGYTAAEAVGRPVDLIIPVVLRGMHWRGFHKAVETGRLKRDAKPFSTVALHKSGRLVPLRAKLELTRTAEGSVDGASAVVLGAGPRALALVASATFPVLRLAQRLRAAGRGRAAAA